MSVPAPPAQAPPLPPADAPPLEWALAYAARGWLVFPVHWIREDGSCSCGDADCGDAGKHPLWFEEELEHGLLDATTDAATLKRWWGRWPLANVAVRTGPESGFFALDVDPRHDGDATLDVLERGHRRLPDTVEALTGGGGRHLLYRYPPTFDVQNATGTPERPGPLGPGIDVRGLRGYIIVAPSGHRSGRDYCWELSGHPDEVDIQAAPQWLLERVRRPSRAVRVNGKAGVDVGAVLAGVAEGERDWALFRFASKLRRADVPRPAAEELVLKAAANCSPPFPADDALKKVASAWRYDPEPEEEEAGTGGQAVAVAPGPERRNGHAPAPAHEEEAESAAPLTLAEVVATFRKWLYLPDAGVLAALLGTVAANRMAGDPVWLLLVGGPGWGKTEPLQALGGLPFARAVGTLSPAALLSGTSRKERRAGSKGGLLKELGAFGLLLAKDFTSILSLRPDDRLEVLGALREIYDGSWYRDVGSEGGTRLTWQGKVGVLGACTPTIDRHHAVIGACGERFIFYRIPPSDRRELARRALQHGGQGAAMRRELAEAVRGLFAGPPLPEAPPALPAALTERLIDLALLVAQARSAVERDGRTHEVELVPDAEAPTRLTKVLSQLYTGMGALGVPDAEAWRVVHKVAFDSLPALRCAVLRVLAAGGHDLPTSRIAERVRHPTSTTRRALEDLDAHEVVTRTPAATPGAADQWRLSDFARACLERVGGVPEKSPRGVSLSL